MNQLQIDFFKQVSKTSILNLHWKTEQGKFEKKNLFDIFLGLIFNSWRRTEKLKNQNLTIKHALNMKENMIEAYDYITFMYWYTKVLFWEK